MKNECYVFDQGKSCQSIVSKTGHSASDKPSHDRKHRRREKKSKKQKNVKVHHIHRVKTRRFFVADPKCRVGYCLIVVIVSVSKSRVFSVRSMQSRQQQSLTFAGKAMIKGAFSHGCSDRASKRHRRAQPSLFPVAALPRVFCCSEIREWNDPALVFWLLCCVVFGRERRKGEDDILGMVEVTCQRKIEGPQDRQLVQEERRGVARGKKRARKWR